MALDGMPGRYSGSRPSSQFAAPSILVPLAVCAVYLSPQKHTVAGLTIRGVTE